MQPITPATHSVAEAAEPPPPPFPVSSPIQCHLAPYSEALGEESPLWNFLRRILDVSAKR